MASQSFSVTDLRTLGPRIEVNVTRSSALRRALEGSEDAEDDQIDKKLPATVTIDTGAQTTMIDSRIIRALGLKHHGTTKVISPGGEKLCLTYDADLGFDSDRHFVRNLRIIEGDFRARQGIDGVIGRDVLEQAILIYQGPTEQYTIAF